MSIRKFIVAVGSALLAAGAWTGAMAQTTTPDSVSSTLGGWDDPAGTRPGIRGA